MNNIDFESLKLVRVASEHKLRSLANLMNMLSVIHIQSLHLEQV